MKNEDELSPRAQGSDLPDFFGPLLKTILQEFYQVAFRKRIYPSIDELQADLDVWIEHYNHQRTHQGKMCCGRTPMDTFADGKKISQEKLIN